MAPSSSAGSTFLERTIRSQNPIPRSLLRIPPNQKALLESEDSWAGSLSKSPVGQTNLPAEVLSPLIYFHTSKIPPPPAQKPPTSSTSLPNGSGNKTSKVQDVDENTAQDSDSEEEVSIPWSTSPSRASPQSPESHNGGHDIRSSPPIQPNNNADHDLRSSPPVPHEPPETQSSGAEPAQLFFTQAPISSYPPAADSSSSIANATVDVHVRTPGPVQPLACITRIPFSAFPPSSAGTEDELPMEIPGAVTHATPPIRKIATRKPQSHSFMDTPPCGQGHLIKSTYPDNMTSSDHPVAGGSSSHINNATQHERPGSSGASGNPHKNTEVKRRKALKPLRFSDEQEMPDPVVLIENTPAPTSAHTKRQSNGQTPSEATSPIASTFPLKESPLIVQKSTKKPKSLAPVVPEDLPEALEHARPTIPSPSTRIEEASELPSLQIQDEDVRKKQSNGNDIGKQPHSHPTTGPTISRPGSSDMSAFFWNHPFEAFCKAYPTFRGSLGDFVRACLSLRSLHRQSKLPVFLYDDFIRIFCDDYIEYIEGTSDEQPKVALEWYVENVEAPVFERRIVTTKNLGRVFKIHNAEFESANDDLSCSTPHSERVLSVHGEHGAPSRRGSDAISLMRADTVHRPITKTPPRYRTISPAVPNGTKRGASIMLSVEDSNESDGDDISHTGPVPRQPETMDDIERPRKRRSPPTHEDIEQPRPRSRPTVSIQSRAPIPQGREAGSDQARTMMPPPRPPPRSNSDMTANDRIKARSKLLPSRAAEPRAQTPTSSSRPSPASPASTVLTQASGVKKRRKKMPSTSEYQARLAKMAAEGRLSSGTSSSAPQPSKRFQL